MRYYGIAHIEITARRTVPLGDFKTADNRPYSDIGLYIGLWYNARYLLIIIPRYLLRVKYEAARLTDPIVICYNARYYFMILCVKYTLLFHDFMCEIHVIV